MDQEDATNQPEIRTTVKTNLQAEWAEGTKEDFDDLHAAIEAGQTEKFPGQGQDSSSSDDEPEVEPPESEPGPRLLWAAQHNETEIMTAILEAHPELIKFQDSDGYTALHRASYSNHLDAARLLLQSGADLSATTHEGWTPLHSACRWNSSKVVELLLGWGADPNRPTEGGQTPLHLAAFCERSRATLQLLLMCDLVHGNVKNCQGDTPRDIAARNSNGVTLFDDLLDDCVNKATMD